ncbi:MAG: hypothetical protein HKL80_08725 [Acidimicrobiales bacterium]|nr:hypothetical protein [Acidimicrobiales bacterium]
MSKILDQTPTAAANLTSLSSPSIQYTLTIDELARDIAARAGFPRNKKSLIDGEATAIRHGTFQVRLETRTSRIAKEDPVEILNELLNYGFAWRDISNMIGVSIPSLRRCRNGERPTGSDRGALAQLLAFIQIIENEHRVSEPASWMEVPIASEAPTNGIDLYINGYLGTLYDLAAQQCSPEAALDIAEPGWRDKYRSNWEVVSDDDDQPYIKFKSADGSRYS